MDSAGNLSQIYTNTSFKLTLNLTFDEYIFDNSAIRFVLYVIYTLIFGLCFLGNLAVVIVVTLHWRMRTATKFCMGNLAFAKLCVAIFCIYQNLSIFLQENWIFGRLLCKMYHFTHSLSHSASVLILVVICGERYLSIVHPLRCRVMLTMQRLRVTIAGVWVLSGVISSPRLFYMTTFELPIPVGPNGHYDVICAPQRTRYDSRTADMINFVVLFLLPLIVMSVLYTKIASVLWKSSTTLPAPPITTSPAIRRSQNGAEKDCCDPRVLKLPPSAPNQSPVNEQPSGSPLTSESNIIVSIRKRKRENLRGHRERRNPANGFDDCKRKWRIFPSKRRGSGGSIGKGESDLSADVLSRIKSGQVPQSRRAAIRMLIIIVVTFVACNFPYHVRKICQYHMGNDLLWSSCNQFLTPITFLLMYTNCAINPILYFFMSKDCRSSFGDLLKCRLARQHSQEVK